MVNLDLTGSWTLSTSDAHTTKFYDSKRLKEHLQINKVVQ